MNKQEREIKKTASPNVNYNTLLSIFFAFRSSRSIRNKYNLNVYCISILVSCYVYSISVKSVFSINNIVLFYTVYSYYRVKKYLVQLCSIDLMTLVGSNKYTLTDKGISAIEEISQNSESLIYEYCSRYGIEL